MSEKIYSEKGKVMALVIRASECRCDGIQFFTEPTHTLQLGYMHHQPGRIIGAHFHKPAERLIQVTGEVLIVKSGKVRLDLYDEWVVPSVMLGPGDMAVLLDGGHGLHIVEEAEIIEVKQGPYLGVDDKVMIKGSAGEVGI